MGKYQKLEIILLLCASILLGSCKPVSEDTGGQFVDYFASSKLLYATPEDELIAVQKNDTFAVYPGYQTGRWMYSNYEATLYQDATFSSYDTAYTNDRGSGTIGINQDECGGGALIGEIEALLYVADAGILAGEEANGSLVLAVYSPKLDGPIRLYEFATNKSDLTQPESCFIGTNAEYDGQVFFSEVKNGRHELRRLDLVSREVTTVFTDDLIMAPAVSPRGDRIAYTKFDGIYIYDLASGEKRQLVALPWRELRDYDFDYHYFSFLNYVPVVSWRPSGNQFSYHVEEIHYDDETGERTLTYAIYLYDFNTQESTLYLENALHPYWILP